MNDFGLDLAVIGNGHTAALMEPSGRLVWWCFPRLDGDPLFSRLLAGNEEKGFSDIVLDDMAVVGNHHYPSEKNGRYATIANKTPYVRKIVSTFAETTTTEKNFCLVKTFD